MKKDSLEQECWRNAALRLGEKICDSTPSNYYSLTSREWCLWALRCLPNFQRQSLTYHQHLDAAHYYAGSAWRDMIKEEYERIFCNHDDKEDDDDEEVEDISTKLRVIVAKLEEHEKKHTEHHLYIKILLSSMEQKCG